MRCLARAASALPAPSGASAGPRPARCASPARCSAGLNTSLPFQSFREEGPVPPPPISSSGVIAIFCALRILIFRRSFAKLHQLCRYPFWGSPRCLGSQIQAQRPMEEGQFFLLLLNSCTRGIRQKLHPCRDGARRPFLRNNFKGVGVVSGCSPASSVDTDSVPGLCLLAERSWTVVSETPASAARWPMVRVHCPFLGHLRPLSQPAPTAPRK